MTTEEKRNLFMKYAWAFVGTWYSWGGDDPSGFDCSGLLIECCQAVGLLGSGDWRARDLCNKWAGAGCRVEKPYRGCVVFWLDNPLPVGNAYHVEICLNDELALGAKGGGSSVTTKGVAIARNAFVKVRPIPQITQSLVASPDNPLTDDAKIVFMDIFKHG